MLEGEEGEWEAAGAHGRLRRTETADGGGAGAAGVGLIWAWTGGFFAGKERQGRQGRRRRGRRGGGVADGVQARRTEGRSKAGRRRRIEGTEGAALVGEAGLGGRQCSRERKGRGRRRGRMGGCDGRRRRMAGARGRLRRWPMAVVDRGESGEGGRKDTVRVQ